MSPLMKMQPTFNAADQVVSAILGTREGAAEGGYQLASTGVTWTDPTQAAALRDALATRKIENVMLVSAFLAAAALAHSVGNETNYAQTALLFIEPDTATLAVVTVPMVRSPTFKRQPLPEDDDAAVAQLAELVSGCRNAADPARRSVRRRLRRRRPADQAGARCRDLASGDLARGARDGAGLRSGAGVSEHAAVRSSTAALAYAQDPGTGAVNRSRLTPPTSTNRVATPTGALAYSAVAGDHDPRAASRARDRGAEPLGLFGQRFGVDLHHRRGVPGRLTGGEHPGTPGTRPDPGPSTRCSHPAGAPGSRPSAARSGSAGSGARSRAGSGSGSRSRAGSGAPGSSGARAGAAGSRPGSCRRCPLRRRRPFRFPFRYLTTADLQSPVAARPGGGAAVTTTGRPALGGSLAAVAEVMVEAGRSRRRPRWFGIPGIPGIPGI